MEEYIYIKSSIQGNYVKFNEPLDESLYNNLGNTWKDYVNGMWVLLSNELVLFHIDHPNASVEDVWYMRTEKEETLLDAKKLMLDNIDRYDKSLNVNGFTINNELEGWITPEERSDYNSSINAAKLIGIEEVTFYIENLMINLPIQTAEYMLALILLYANQCYIVTKQHKLYVESLLTIEEIKNFDYTADYPEKLNFNISSQILRNIN